jgi:hypothetical protein
MSRKPITRRDFLMVAPAARLAGALIPREEGILI